MNKYKELSNDGLLDMIGKAMLMRDCSLDARMSLQGSMLLNELQREYDARVKKENQVQS